MEEISSEEMRNKRDDDCFDFFKIVPYTIDNPMNLFSLVSKEQ